MKRLITLLATGLVAFYLFLPATPAGAAAFAVSNLNDSGLGSLRQAIIDTNATPGADTINFSMGGKGVGPMGTITLLSALPAIIDSLTIVGPGSGVLTINANNLNAHIQINALPIAVNISGLTYTGAKSTNAGGAMLVLNGATVNLTDVNLVGNQTTNGGGGGGLLNAGNTTVRNSVISNNTGTFGGGIENFANGVPASLVVEDTTISNNKATIGGGGIDSFGATLTLRRSSVIGNSLTGTACCGSALQLAPESATLTSVVNIEDSTLDNNSGEFTIYSFGTLNVTRSSISGNTARGSGVAGLLNYGVAKLDTVQVRNNKATSANSIGAIVNCGEGVCSDPNVPATKSMTILNSILDGNTGASVAGAVYSDGVANSSPLVITNTTISNNSASTQAAGIYNSQPATITNTTIVNNIITQGQAGFIGGGGIANLNPGNATLTNVTVGGNSGGLSNGGGVFNNGTLALNNVTINGNKAALGGGLRIGAGGTARLLNTIVANSTTGGDCAVAGIGFTLGGNLASDATCGFPAPELNSTNPLLAPLANNGGATQTYLPQSGSPAIDRGTNTGCPSTDQRGVSRPQDGNNDGIATCDIGAVEVTQALGKGTTSSGATASADSGSYVITLQATGGAVEEVVQTSHTTLTAPQRSGTLLVGGDAVSSAAPPVQTVPVLPAPIQPAPPSAPTSGDVPAPFRTKGQ